MRLFISICVALTIFSCKKEKVVKREFVFKGTVHSWDSSETINNARISLEVHSRKGIFGEYEDYNFSTCFTSDNNGIFNYEYEELDIRDHTEMDFSLTTKDGFSYYFPDVLANLSYDQDWYMEPRLGKVEAIIEIDWNLDDTLYYTIEPKSITGASAKNEINCFWGQDDFEVRGNQNGRLVQSKRRVIVWSTNFDEFKRLAFEYAIGNRTDNVLKNVDTFSISGLPTVDKVLLDGKP